MLKYAQIVNEQTKQVNVGLGTDVEFYKSIGMTEMDVEQCEWNSTWYLTGYAPKKPEPTPEQEIETLKRELADVDEKSMRAVRAKLTGKSTEEDDLFLNQLELRAEQLRQRIRDLQEN